MFGINLIDGGMIQERYPMNAYMGNQSLFPENLDLVKNCHIASNTIID